jgi:hypothetical protein
VFHYFIQHLISSTTQNIQLGFKKLFNVSLFRRTSYVINDSEHPARFQATLQRFTLSCMTQNVQFGFKQLFNVSLFRSTSYFIHDSERPVRFQATLQCCTLSSYILLHPWLRTSSSVSSNSSMFHFFVLHLISSMTQNIQLGFKQLFSVSLFRPTSYFIRFRTSSSAPSKVLMKAVWYKLTKTRSRTYRVPLKVWEKILKWYNHIMFWTYGISGWGVQCK